MRIKAANALGWIGVALGLVGAVILFLVSWMNNSSYSVMVSNNYLTLIPVLSLYFEPGTRIFLQVLAIWQLGFVITGAVGMVISRRFTIMAAFFLLVSGLGLAFTISMPYWLATPLLLAAAVLFYLEGRAEPR